MVHKLTTTFLGYQLQYSRVKSQYFTALHCVHNFGCGSRKKLPVFDTQEYSSSHNEFILVCYKF